jgi:hypothetical protein
MEPWDMGKTQKKIVVILISLIIVLLFLSIYIATEEKIPDNAVVVVTVEDKLYHSIYFDYICVEGKTAQTMTLSEALAEGYQPHSYDIDLGYFRGNRRFLFHHVLSKLGVKINSRWDKEGNWLW